MKFDSYDYMVMQSAIATLHEAALDYDDMRMGNRFTEKHYHVMANRLDSLSTMLDRLFRRVQEIDEAEEE